jgi:competence protein ComFC
MLKTEHYKKSIPNFSLDKVVVGGYYDEEMQRKIRRFKFVQNRVDHVYFWSIFSQIEEEFPYTPDIIVYPPISLRDRIFRWPNHAKIFTQLLSETDALIACPFQKKFFSSHQSRRTKRERSKVRDEFFLSSNIDFRGKKILIVDDVITTGYTAHTLGKLLKKAGAREVVGYFLASEKV